MFSWINDIIFVKKRQQGLAWLNVSFWYAGVVLILLLSAPPETRGACSCDSSVPPCQNSVSSDNNNTISNGTTALSSCNKVARADCPCCFVCAGQMGTPCSPAQPCDSSHSLVCSKDNVCQKEVMSCHHEEKIYLPDETFYTQNCQTRCTCSADGGQTFCQPTTCRPGLLIRGFLAEDPLCEERQVDSDDECCVLVVCSSVAEETETTVDSRKREQDNNLTTTRRPESTTEPSEGRTQNNNHNSSNNSSFSNLEFLQITPTTIQVQFPGITGGNLMYVEDRLFKGDGHDAFGHSSTPWENAIILEGNEIFTLTGLKAKTTYRLRWQAPNKQYPDLVVETHAYGEKPPKVIITGRTYDSITLSFDHFAPEEYHHGYVAMFKEASGGRWINYDEGDATDEESFMGDLPSITITKLKPDTDYMARIAIYKDYATRSLGKSTAVIEFRTSKGCFHQNESYPIGSFYVGCESSCECGEDGSVECSDRCEAPLRPAGRTSDDPLCVEQFLNDDKCCVLVTCAGNADEDDPEGPCLGIKCGPNAECRHEVFRGEGAETICVCKEGYSGDPDSQRGCNEHLNSPDLATVKPKEGCIVKNETYGVNDEWFDGCDYKCACSQKLEILCQPRCKGIPDVASVKKCELRPDPEDSCCKVMFCPDPKAMDDLKPVTLPFDGCAYKNLTYKQGERFYDGCEQQCQCMGYGDMVCLSRCPPTAPAPGQNCYTLPDASDPCCNITVCDKPVPDPDQNVPKEGANKEPKQPRVIDEFELTEAFPDEVTITTEPTTLVTSEELNALPDKCTFNNETYDIGAEFYDNCEHFCSCHAASEDGVNPEVVCNPIKCPSAFGLDIINPFCLEWDNHDTFDAVPPTCCPPQPVCIHDGTCTYEGQKFNNFDNIPANLTGCEKRCYCENGEVLCQDACYDIPEEPPGYLSCAQNIAIKVPKDDRPCCQTWGCPKLGSVLPDKLSSVVFNPLNETSFAVNLRVPKELEGRSGFYKIFFTSGLQGHPDPEKWPSINITPKNGLFSVDENEISSFVLNQLLPNTQYFLKVALHVRDADAEKVILSEILSAKTPEVTPITVEPPSGLEIRRIDVNLTVENVESTSAFLSWRFFSLEEKQFLDGVQIRFTELRDGSPASGVPGTTPFIHRDTNFFLLEDLKPDAEYQVDLYLIPVPNANTELISNSTVAFKTKAPLQDPFEFEIQLKVDEVTKQIVSLSWTGVPTPHQKYINIYRILYLEDHSNSLEGRSVFKVAKIDSSRSARITHLRPATKYQMWLEAYLRNGKVIQSNVLEVETEDGQYDPLADYDESQEPLTGGEGVSDGYYYKSMVAAIVVAVIVSVILIVLGGLYLKRNITYKAIISGGANRSELAHSNKGGDGISSLSSRGSSGIAKSDSFEMNGMGSRNHFRLNGNGNGNAKSSLENP